MSYSLEFCKTLRTSLLSRKPPVRLIAVSKGQAPDKIRALYEDGQREFGENYVEELEEKSESLRDLKDLRWIFIGTVQSNKIQRIMRRAAEIQTLASEKHVRFVSRYADELGLAPYPVFLEVNCDPGKKGGIGINDAGSLSNSIEIKYPSLRLLGLMAIPPAQYSDATCGGNIPPLYQQLALAARSVGAGQLSLGMSGDMQIALDAGSNCLRIGRALFGISIETPGQ